MKTILLFLAVLMAGCLMGSSAADAGKGKALFEKRCSGCHAMDRIQEGPRLGKVFGQRAGAAPGFPYSKALNESRVVWNEVNLDRWLEDPERFIPGNDMATRVPNAGDRANLIAYLKTAGASGK